MALAKSDGIGNQRGASYPNVGCTFRDTRMDIGMPTPRPPSNAAVGGPQGCLPAPDGVSDRDAA